MWFKLIIQYIKYLKKKILKDLYTNIEKELKNLYARIEKEFEDTRLFFVDIIILLMYIL